MSSTAPNPTKAQANGRGAAVLTTSFGAPIDDNQNSLTVGYVKIMSPYAHCVPLCHSLAAALMLLSPLLLTW